MTIKPIDGVDFDEKVNQAAQPVVVDFWLANCPPCQTLEPQIAAVAQAFAGRVKVYRLDVEKSPAISEQLRRESTWMPCLKNCII